MAHGIYQEEFILKGNVEKEDDNIKLNVSLIEIEEGKRVWNKGYEGHLEDIFSIQSSICQKTAQTLGLNDIQQAPEFYSLGRNNNYQAYENYLKGNHILNNFRKENSDPWKLYYQGKYYSGKRTEEGNELAIALFSQVLNLDDRFAQAYLGLANCYINNINLNWDFDIRWLNKAQELIQKAQTIQPDLPEYYTLMITINLIKEIAFNENKVQLAFTLAKEGLSKYPNQARLNSIAGYCYFLRFGQEGDETDFKKALEYKEKNFWLNPYDFSNIGYVELLMLNKEFNKALEVCNIIRKQDESLMSEYRLGEIYYYMGDLEQSQAIFQRFDSPPLEFKIGALLHLGMIATQRGERKEAKRILQEFHVLTPTDSMFSYDQLKLSSIYLRLGMDEKGYEFLRSFFNLEINKKIKYISKKYVDIDENFEHFKEEDEFLKIMKGEY